EPAEGGRLEPCQGRRPSRRQSAGLVAISGTVAEAAVRRCLVGSMDGKRQPQSFGSCFAWMLARGDIHQRTVHKVCQYGGVGGWKGQGFPIPAQEKPAPFIASEGSHRDRRGEWVSQDR